MEPGPVKPGLHQIFPDADRAHPARPGAVRTRRPHGRDQQLRRPLRAHPRRRALARGLPRRVQAQPPGLRHRRRAHAPRDRRAADGGHPQRPAAVAHLRQQGHQDLPRLRRVLRHGRRHRAGGVLLPPCGAGSGGKEADPLPAGPSGRRQELHRRAPEGADAGGAVLRHQGLAGERVAARPVQRRGGRPDPREGIRHPAPLPQPHHEPLGGEAAGGVRRRHPAVQGHQAPPVDPEAGGHQQDRAGRREQPGHQLAGRQGRHPQARDVCAGRPGRVQLLRRPVPGQPGPAGIRRDVQGADQGAAPAAHRHAGGQLQGHRGLRRDPVRRRGARAQQRERVEDLPQQQEQRGLPRPHLHRQGAVLPARQ
jgi:hypothetical protein